MQPHRPDWSSGGRERRLSRLAEVAVGVNRIVGVGVFSFNIVCPTIDQQRAIPSIVAAAVHQLARELDVVAFHGEAQDGLLRK